MPEDKPTKSTDSEESQQQNDIEQSQTQSKPEELCFNQEEGETISGKPENKMSHFDELVDKEENKDSINTETTESNKILAAEESSVKSQLDELQEKFVRLEKECAQLDELRENVIRLEKGFAQQEAKNQQIQKQIEQLQKLESKTVNRRSPRPKREKVTPPIVPVAYLQENGKEKLQNKLGDMTNDELKNTLRFFIKKGKDIKTIQREEMITEIIKYAERELNRGSSFFDDR